MKTARKVLVLALCAVLLVSATIMGTMAYLTSTDEVVNTFTVGNVQIKLDEAKANADGSLVANADRVKANTYKLLPGHTYNKDPMVTVLEGSEECYVKMTLTYNNAAFIDSKGVLDWANITNVLIGYNEANWILKGGVEDKTNDTRTLTFYYKDTVDASAADVELDALFDKITVPGSLTNEDLASLDEFTMTLNAYAVQADGFTSADAAWTAAGL